jgi:heme exporter protein C
MRTNVIVGIGAVGLMLLLWNIYTMVLVLPDEAMQGPIYRIMFFHIPAAWIALMASSGALIASSLYLIKRDFKYDAWAVGITEVGLAFGAVNLITGTIWARRIWGIWWTWDARLTSALVLWLLYLSYLLLRRAIDDPGQRARSAAVLSILAFIDSPIVFFSIKWWRTQHPQPVVWGGGSMAPEMKHVLYWNWLALLCVAAVFLLIRTRQENDLRRIETLRRTALAY